MFFYYDLRAITSNQRGADSKLEALKPLNQSDLRSILQFTDGGRVSAIKGVRDFSHVSSERQFLIEGQRCHIRKAMPLELPIRLDVRFVFMNRYTIGNRTCLLSTINR